MSKKFIYVAISGQQKEEVSFEYDTHEQLVELIKLLVLKD